MCDKTTALSYLANKIKNVNNKYLHASTYSDIGGELEAGEELYV